MMTFLVRFFYVFAVLFLPHFTWARPIHIGSISTDPAAEIKKFLPFAQYLALELKSEGIDQGKVVVAKSITEMAALLRHGKVALYVDSPFPSLAVSRISGSKFLLKRWKKGIGEYHSVIFVRKDSGINRLEDLKGKVIAFEEPFSSSGYFIPKVALMEKGLKVVPKREATEPVASTEVGYVFTNDDQNTLLWVLRGKVAAGAMDNQNYLTEARTQINHLQIVEKSFPLPRQIVSYTADLPPRLVAKIKEVLIRMDKTEAGKRALENFEKTTKFDELSESMLAPLMKAAKFVDAELGIK